MFEDGQPTYAICPCCGFESGYDGVEEVHFQQYRRRWIASGMPWFSSIDRPPEGWDPIEQLKRAGLLP
jgi:hypothetical protein